MRTLYDLLTVYLDNGLVVWRVYPNYEDIVFKDTPNDTIGTTRECTTEFTFVKSDFLYFSELRRNEGLCGKVDILIMEGGVERYRGVLSVGAGKWSDRQWSVAFTPETRVPDECLEEHKDDEINLLSLETVPPLKILVGQISEPVICKVQEEGVLGINYDIPKACLPDGIGWTLTQLITLDEVKQDRTGQQRGLIDEYTITATYQREVITSANPPGAGWQPIGGGQFARSLFVGAPTIDRRTNNDQNTEELYTEITRDFPIVGNDPTLLPDNGVAAETLLNALLADCPYTVVSDFFGINPDGTAPDNEVYAAAINYQNIVYFQKTDVKNADALENATRGAISLANVLKLWEGLRVFHTVQEGVLRIEHESYFEGNGLDVSNYRQIVGATDFTYQREQIPIRETFAWMDEGGTEDFLGKPIAYDRYCAGGAETSYQATRFSTDVADMASNPDNYANEGFVPIATFGYLGERYMVVAPGIFSPVPLLNQPFAWSVIHDTLYRRLRPLPAGTMNETPTVFNSSRPQRKQQTITVPITYAQYWEFDPSLRVKSQLGWGKVAQAVFSARDSTLTLDLLHNE